MRWGSRAKKRFLSGGIKTVVALILLVVAFSPLGQILTVPNASADSFCVKSNGTVYTPASNHGVCTRPDGAIQATSLADAQQKAKEAQDAKNANALCNSIASCLLLPVYAFTVGLGGFVAYIGSYVFNAAAQLSLNSGAYGLQFVTDGWTTARDIANMGFILILIYIAVSIILSAETAHTMQTLAFVIFIALIINFSFFLTRVVIDAGNILALQFYNAIPTVVINGQASTAAGTKDLTASIMNAVGAQQILGTQSFAAFQNNTSGFSEFITLLIIYIFVGAIYFILAAAFISVGIKFIVRIAVLWLAIIASPLALVAKASHRFEKYYDQWQEILISHAFYPVVFLFIFWLITSFAAGLNINQSFLSAVSSTPGGSKSNFGIIEIGGIVANISIRLGFIIVMLFIGIKAADGMGAMGGKLAANVTSRLPGFSGLASYARLGGTLSNRIGPGAWAGYADSKLKNSRVGNSTFGYGLRQVVTKPVAEAKIGGAESRTQLKDRWEKEGKEKKGNLNTIQNKEYAKNLKAFDAAHPNFDEEAKEIPRLEQEEADHQQGGHLYDDSRLKELRNLKNERDVLAEHVSNFRKPQLEGMKASEIEGIVKYINESQLKAVKDSDKFSEADKDKLHTLWHEKSKDSPVQKANDQIKQLRKITEQLKGSRYMLADIKNKIGYESAPLKPVINMTTAGNMKDEATIALNAAKDRVRTRKKVDGTDANDAEVTAERTTINKLEKAVKRLENLEDNLKNVPIGAGGVQESKSFDTAKVS